MATRTNGADDPKTLEDGPGLHYEDNPLRQSVTLNSEQFERLYLQPKGQAHGGLRKTFANPTPLALMGFSVGLFPLSIALMGWRGAGGNAVATIASTIWFGGVLLWLAGIGEFILGNTFPFIVFMGYGAHFLTFGTTFLPQFGAVAFYTKTNTYSDNNQLTPEFEASFGYYPLALGLLSFVFLICSLRTNVVFVLIFVLATIGFCAASGAFFQLAQGATELGTTLIVTTGACFFGATMLGWYIFLAIMLQEMDFPGPNIPIGDLSTVIRGKSEKAKERTE